MRDETLNVAAEVKAAPVVNFRAGFARSEAVKLEWPIDVDGVAVDEIIVRRMSVADIAAWQKSLAAANEGERHSIAPPMLFLANGEPLTPEIAKDLDVDDDARLDEVIGRFLPRSLRQTKAE